MSGSVPRRTIAPYTTVELQPSGHHVLLSSHGENFISLDRDGVALLLHWLRRAGFKEAGDEWPGLPG
jgi:hypothetical protein